MPSGRVVWVPFPVVGSSAVATHVWIDVVAPAVGATATAAITTSDGHGRPGVLLATTLDDAIDLSVAGVQGAPLVEPTVLPVAAGWWVAVVVHADGDEPIARGGEDLVGRPTIHAGSAPPVVPGQDLSAGALHLDRRESIPEAADLQLRQLHGPVPVLHVSLEAP